MMRIASAPPARRVHDVPGRPAGGRPCRPGWVRRRSACRPGRVRARLAASFWLTVMPGPATSVSPAAAAISSAPVFAEATRTSPCDTASLMARVWLRSSATRASRPSTRRLLELDQLAQVAALPAAQVVASGGGGARRWPRQRRARSELPPPGTQPAQHHGLGTSSRGRDPLGGTATTLMDVRQLSRMPGKASDAAAGSGNVARRAAEGTAVPKSRIRRKSVYTPPPPRAAPPGVVPGSPP